MQLFLWKLSQDENNDYETYDSAVVVAADRMSASLVHPARFSDTKEMMFEFDRTGDCWRHTFDGEPLGPNNGGWCQPNDVTVICVGRAADHLKAGDVVCSSYNAG